MPLAAVLQQEMLWVNPTSLQASIQGRASSSSTLVGAGVLSGFILGHTADTGTLKGVAALAGSIVGHTADTGTLKGIGALADTILGHTAVIGTTKGSTALSSTILGHTADSGTLKGAGVLAGSVLGHTTDSGTLKGTGTLISFVLGHTADSGTLKGSGVLVGSVLGHSNDIGTLVGAGHAVGSVVGHATVSLLNGSIVYGIANIVGHAFVVGQQKAVFNPMVVGRMMGSFGVDPNNPPSIQAVGTHTFSKTEFSGLNGFYTADGWGALGQRAMPDQLLIIPGSGYLNPYAYAVIGGDVTIPASAQNVSLTVSLFENYFQQSGQSVSVQSDPLATIVVPTVAGSTVQWSAVVRLRDSGRHNGALIADIMSNGNALSTLYSNFNNSVQPRIQLSVGINLQGSIVGSDLPKVRLLQFDLQKG